MSSAESNAVCAARRLAERGGPRWDRDGISPVNQPCVMKLSAPVHRIPWCQTVIRQRAGELVFHQRQTANRPPTKRRPAPAHAASGTVRSAPDHQPVHGSRTLLVDSFGLPSGSGTPGKLSRLFSANSIHARTPANRRSAPRWIPLTHTEVVSYPRPGVRPGQPLEAPGHAVGLRHLVPIRVASPCTWSMAAKNVNRPSFCTTPKVKQPYPADWGCR